MKTCLALDCGGTKVAAILYTEDLSRAAVCVTGSLRANSTPPALLERHLGALIEELGLRGRVVEELGGICEAHVIESLRAVCEIRAVRLSGELDLGLSAAGIFGDGLLALSGTGATLFARANGKSHSTGGYGFAVADEGSGYFIGRAACQAAIRDREGRGASTSLTDSLPRHLGYGGRQDLREAIFSIYGRTDASPAALVARCAPLVIAEAARGDAVSAAILEEAGRLLGEQLCALIREHGLPDSLPMTVSGSVWRGNPILLSSFLGVMRAQCARRPFVAPTLEPVLGVLARRMWETYGRFDPDALGARYAEFRYDINKNQAAETIAAKEEAYAAGSLQGSR